MAAGEVRITNRDCASGRAIAEALAAGGDVILRLRWGALRLASQDGARFDLVQHLASFCRPTSPSARSPCASPPGTAGRTCRCA